MKANKQLIFQWVFTLGLTGAALMLAVVIGSPDMPSHYRYNQLPAIKSRYLHYLCSMWSLLVRKEEAPAALTSRNLFLLINLIIFLILSSMHLQQHAAASAAQRKARKRRRTLHKENPGIFGVDSPQPLHGSSLSSCIEKEQDAAEAPMPSGACVTSPDQACMETSSNGCISTAAISCVLQVDPQAFKEELFPNEDLNTAGSASLEILPAKYPGPAPAAVAANDNEPCWSLDQDCRPTASQVERIVLEEDGRLQLIEMPRGSDAQKNEDGRLGCADRPVPTPSRRAQRKPQPQSAASCANCNSDTKSSYHFRGNDSHSYPSSNAGFEGQIVPKSISLNSNDLLLCEHEKVKSSEANFGRSRVKSIDTGIRSRQKRGKNNAVKRAFGLRREPSMNSQEELNTRVESFIAKFNESMKIQRQQSLISYMQMVDRGA